MDDRELSSGHRSLSGYAYLSGAASLPTGSNGWHRGTEGASQYVNGRNGGIKENFRRERWIEVGMAWHEHIYEMSANPFLTSFASLFHSVLSHLLHVNYQRHSDKAGSAPGDCRCDYPKRWRRGI